MDDFGAARSRGGLEDEVDDLLGYPVGATEIQTGDDDEAQHDARRLEDLRAVGPLHALKLSPARAQEGNGATWQRFATTTLHLAGVTSAIDFLSRRFNCGESITRSGLGIDRLRLIRQLLWSDRYAFGAPHERGIELVHAAGGVVQRARQVPTTWLTGGCIWTARSLATSLALLCTFAVTGHSWVPALTRLPMAGVFATPAAVLAQRHPIGVVALALVCLIVAMLALLACEGDSDSHISAGHVPNP